MVFANLGQRDKGAFFSLLDEYFASRPEIFANNNNAQSDGLSNATASAVRQAVTSNPQASANAFSAGLKHLANNRSSVTGSGNSGAGTGESSGKEGTSIAGRVAAAQAAFSGKHNPFAAKLGNILKEQSSTPSPNTPSPSSALTPKQSNFAAPPIRKVPSSASTRQPSPQPPPEERGEWVEALYDYDSGETGDLKIAEGQKILLVERTSDDWWTGEFSGQRGLFPASYAKVL